MKWIKKNFPARAPNRSKYFFFSSRQIAKRSYQVLCPAQRFSSNFSTRVSWHMTFVRYKFTSRCFLKGKISPCGHLRIRKKVINLRQFCLWTLKLISCCELASFSTWNILGNFFFVALSNAISHSLCSKESSVLSH